MKKALVALLLIVLVAAGVYYVRNGGSEEDLTAFARQTAEAKRGLIRQVVECTGRIVSNRDIEIKCRASGEIIKLPVDISDPVRKDDLLLELDPVDQERLCQQAEANLAASQARLAQAENNLLTSQKALEASKQKVAAALDSAKARAQDTAAKAKRQQELLEKKYSSPEQYETAQTAAIQAEQELRTVQAQLGDLAVQELELETRRQDINLNKAQVDNNKIALGLAQRQLGYTKVYAPIDGVVAARTVQIGQIISSGVTNIGGGTTTMILADLSRMYIYASVDESNIGLVKLGQDAEITADAFPRMKFNGKVYLIGTKGVNLQNVVTFEVRIEITSENKTLLKPEMTANVTILIAQNEDALLVPFASIIREKRETFINVVKPDGTEERRPVQIGLTDGVDTEIVSGLEENETITYLSLEEESRWRADSDARDKRSRDRVMMKTLGGSSSRR
ncbi:MAG TPA: efflux RND transporter periplasmic adaptor subunit [Candidatus Bathyarchaeia archaeon]|nr:efflux RND transporter periplasmic adaptor subunit [Candidatus Bathyarchaeia archaeon]